VRLRGRPWTFLADRGVFAAGAVDAGTKLLIETMVIHPADDVLDLGCGYGPVGLVAASLAPQGHVTLVDINERAVKLTQEIARRDGLTNVDVRLGDGCAPVGDQRFDVIVMNPPIRAGKATLKRLFHDAWTHLRVGGRFYFVARTAQGAKTLAREVETVFRTVTEEARGSGYRVYCAIKEEESVSPEAPDV
jgi:16S rRNA (guanine1207-N2)-methyltransferase